mmetsp:Transcript_97482/g.179134  ORF Transcript_97482/g.179134 Transcript_97482/m.179134 type:complete len:463 (+) Transcript_97482:111-1499(+)
MLVCARRSAMLTRVVPSMGLSKPSGHAYAVRQWCALADTTSLNKDYELRAQSYGLPGRGEKLRSVESALFAEHAKVTRMVFSMLDDNYDGNVRVAELPATFVAQRSFLPEDFLASVTKAMRELDTDGDGIVTYPEFVQGCSHDMRLQAFVAHFASTAACMLQEAFNRLDLDGDRLIGVAELREALKRFPPGVAKQFDVDAEQMLRKFDVDGDGKLNFRDFCLATQADQVLQAIVASVSMGNFRSLVFGLRQHREIFSPSHWQEYFDRIKEDPYCPGRYKRIAWLKVDLQRDSVQVLGNEPLFQPKEFNPTHGDLVRNYESCEQSFLDRPDTLAFIKDFAAFWKVDSNDVILFQMQRVRADVDAAGEPTVEGIHRDGIQALSVTCVNRVNVVGGESVIYEDLAGERQVLRTMLQPGNSLYMQDMFLYHYVSPIRSADGVNPGYRDIIIMTTPSQHQMPNYYQI